jgi:hypothetical protein
MVSIIKSTDFFCKNKNTKQQAFHGDFLLKAIGPCMDMIPGPQGAPVVPVPHGAGDVPGPMT